MDTKDFVDAADNLLTGRGSFMDRAFDLLDKAEKINLYRIECMSHFGIATAYAGTCLHPLCFECRKRGENFFEGNPIGFECNICGQFSRSSIPMQRGPRIPINTDLKARFEALVFSGMHFKLFTPLVSAFRSWDGSMEHEMSEILYRYEVLSGIRRDVSPDDFVRFLVDWNIPVNGFPDTTLAILETINFDELTEQNNKNLLKQILIRNPTKSAFPRYLVSITLPLMRRVERVEGVNFKEVDLSNFDLSGIAFFQCDFEGADMRGCNLESTSLVECNINNVAFDERTSINSPAYNKVDGWSLNYLDADRGFSILIKKREEAIYDYENNLLLPILTWDNRKLDFEGIVAVQDDKTAYQFTFRQEITVQNVFKPQTFTLVPPKLPVDQHLSVSDVFAQIGRNFEEFVGAAEIGEEEEGLLDQAFFSSPGYFGVNTGKSVHGVHINGDSAHVETLLTVEPRFTILDTSRDLRYALCTFFSINRDQNLYFVVSIPDRRVVFSIESTEPLQISRKGTFVSRTVNENITIFDYLSGQEVGVYENVMAREFFFSDDMHRIAYFFRKVRDEENGDNPYSVYQHFLREINDRHGKIAIMEAAEARLQYITDTDVFYTIPQREYTVIRVPYRFPLRPLTTFTNTNGTPIFLGVHTNPVLLKAISSSEKDLTLKIVTFDQMLTLIEQYEAEQGEDEGEEDEDNDGEENEDEEEQQENDDDDDDEEGEEAYEED